MKGPPSDLRLIEAVRKVSLRETTRPGCRAAGYDGHAEGLRPLHTYPGETVSRHLPWLNLLHWLLPVSCRFRYTETSICKNGGEQSNMLSAVVYACQGIFR